MQLLFESMRLLPGLLCLILFPGELDLKAPVKALSYFVLLTGFCFCMHTLYQLIVKESHKRMYYLLLTSMEPPMKRRAGLWIVQAGRGSYRGS